MHQIGTLSAELFSFWDCKNFSRLRASGTTESFSALSTLPKTVSSVRVAASILRQSAITASRWSGCAASTPGLLLSRKNETSSLTMSCFSSLSSHQEEPSATPCVVPGGSLALYSCSANKRRQRASSPEVPPRFRI